MTTSTSLVPIPGTTEPDETPPFDGLTAMQSRFVRAYVQNGDGNGCRAARDAGYSPSSSAVIGSRLLRNPNVQQAMMSEVRSALAASAPIAVATQTRLARQARSEFVQQQAAADLLDRAGFKPPDKHQHLIGGGLVIDIKL
jgi:phage terminase small subunit